MTIQIKKAGEAISRNVVRAISAKEAPSIAPARESTKVTMMPWKGWFLRWFQDQVTPETYKKFREFWFFYPDEPYDLQQVNAHKEFSISKDDPTLTRAYRTPSPGSEGPVKLPEFDLDTDEDPYDSAYYKRDTRRRWEYSETGNPHIEGLKLAILQEHFPDDENVKAEIAKFEAGPESSPGNKGVFATGPTDYDPTGLRATMSTNWKSLNESLDKHMPDHLPTPIWVGKEEEVDKHYVDRGIPAPFGAYYEPLKVPTWRRVATW